MAPSGEMLTLLHSWWFAPQSALASLRRFVVQGPGAILEAVGSFENLRIKEIPGKGPLATVSDEDNAFECHVRYDRGW